MTTPSRAASRRRVGLAAWSASPSSLKFTSTARTIPPARAKSPCSGTRFCPGEIFILIYGAMRDKAVDEIAGLLFPRASTVILTSPAQPRAISAPVLAEMTGHHAQRVEVIPDPTQALERALELASPEDVIFVTGSLYLVGDLRRYWASRAKDSTGAAPAKHSPAST